LAAAVKKLQVDLAESKSSQLRLKADRDVAAGREKAEKKEGEISSCTQTDSNSTVPPRRPRSYTAPQLSSQYSPTRPPSSSHPAAWSWQSRTPASRSRSPPPSRPVVSSRPTASRSQWSQRRLRCDRKLNLLDGHVDGRYEESSFMVDRRDAERPAVDINNGRCCEADNGDVLLTDKGGVDKATH
jgi:hypothetical protein